MALQSSGAISFANIQTEFGGSNPISLSEYYGVATLPSSGAISMSQFYGTSNAYTLSYLVIAGGGSGGGYYFGGGGGAGGYRNSYGSESSGANSSSLAEYTVASGTTITVTVGAGGAQLTGYQWGNDGSNSQISGSGLTTRTSNGGGGGGAWRGNSWASGDWNWGRLGGSSGGNSHYARYNSSGDPYRAGMSGQGKSGAPTGSSYEAGGGGGAGVNGNSNGTGGNGLASSITGSSTYRAGGGGGGSGSPSGGLGGGGNGGAGTWGTAATVNTGSGGGGAGDAGGGRAGGSGIVVLRMPTSNYSGTKTGSPAVSTSGSYTILKFTGSGSYTT